MIFLSTPHVSGRELDLIAQVFAANQIMPLGSMLTDFETAYCKATRAKHALALSSATAALQLALRCFGVERGDSVWTSSLTFIGGVSPIIHEGAIPTFFDCDAQSWTLNCDLLEEELDHANQTNTLPKAIVPTDLYGQSSDIDRLEDLAQRYGIKLIFDSAEVLGGKYKGRPAGCGGDASVHSFNGNKMITASGGGMLLTQDQKARDLAFKLATQAREPTENNHYHHEMIGHNFRMSNVMAAIGLGQLETLDDKVRLRRAIFDRYAEALAELDFIQFMPEASYGECSRWLSVFTLQGDAGARRDALLRHLAELEIEARPVWKPMNMQPVFKDARFVGEGLCDDLYSHGVCLPSSPGLTLADQTKVIEAIKTFFAE